MSPQTQISVIVPCYNIKQYIDDCMDSILSQKGEIENGFRVLCIDDGSSDGTSEILAKYAKKYPRIVYMPKHENRNYGVSVARNLGLDNITGETVMFVDGDDAIGGTETPHLTDRYFLENFYTTLKARPNTAMIVGSIVKFTGDEIVRTEHDVVSDNKLEKIKKGDPDFIRTFDFLDYRISSCATLYRSDLINKYKLRFRSDMMYFEDAHFVMQYAFAAQREREGEREQRYDYILNPTDTPALYLYRTRPDSAISKLSNHSESGMRHKEQLINCSRYYAYALSEAENLFGIESRIYHSFARSWANKAESILNKIHGDYIFDEPQLHQHVPRYCQDCNHRRLCPPLCSNLATLRALVASINTPFTR